MKFREIRGRLIDQRSRITLGLIRAADLCKCLLVRTRNGVYEYSMDQALVTATPETDYPQIALSVLSPTSGSTSLVGIGAIH